MSAIVIGKPRTVRKHIKYSMNLFQKVFSEIAKTEYTPVFFTF